MVAQTIREVHNDVGNEGRRVGGVGGGLRVHWQRCLEGPLVTWTHGPTYET